MTTLSDHQGTELAHRSSAGMDVTLLWVQGDDEDTAVVCVSDSRECAYFALDAYYHLFFYRDFSSPTTTAA
jgi:hypothetical protein